MPDMSVKKGRPTQSAGGEKHIMICSASPMTEILVVADCWRAEADAEAIIHRAIETAAGMVDEDTGDAELAIMLTDNAGIHTLNANWRGIDKPTNVLSFPALQPTVRPFPTIRRVCSGTLRSPMKLCVARPTTNTNRSVITSAIWLSMGFCI